MANDKPLSPDDISHLGPDIIGKREAARQERLREAGATHLGPDIVGVDNLSAEVTKKDLESTPKEEMTVQPYKDSATAQTGRVHTTGKAGVRKVVTTKPEKGSSETPATQKNLDTPMPGGK